jgi:hypothetical protein
MDTLRALNHLSNVLTVDEWAAFKSTDEYHWMVARTNGYRGSSMEELMKRGSGRRREAWSIALEMAESIVADDLRELAANVPDEQRQRTTERLAEKLMVEQGLTPPTFTAWCDCDSCGRVPAPAGTPDSTPNCPWCMP